MKKNCQFRFDGGLYCPSPSPPGFPHYQEKRNGLLLTQNRMVQAPKKSTFPYPDKAIKSLSLIPYSCGFAPVANLIINGSKGEEQHTAVAVCWKEDKNANVHVCVFICNRRHPAAPPSKRHDKKIKNYFSIALRLT